jgi:hypothetical protein
MNGWLIALAIVVLAILLAAQATGTIIGIVQVRRMNRESRARSKKGR